MMKLLHIAAGGTISGCEIDYPQIEKLAHFFSDAVDVGKYLEQSMKIPAEYSMVEVCKKDSREMNNEDRASILNAIQEAYSKGVKHFLITHGTFTMPEIGVYLLNNLPKDLIADVSIVITGAMYPMNLIGGDGLLNIGASVSSLLNSNVALGIVVNMHGKNWDPRRIKKDAKNLIFEEV